MVTQLVDGSMTVTSKGVKGFMRDRIESDAARVPVCHKLLSAQVTQRTLEPKMITKETRGLDGYRHAIEPTMLLKFAVVKSSTLPLSSLIPIISSQLSQPLCDVMHR